MKLAGTNDILAKKFFTKFLPQIKVSPFDAELNSESNDVVFMDGRYLVKTFLANKSFVPASFTPNFLSQGKIHTTLSFIKRVRVVRNWNKRVNTRTSHSDTMNNSI